MKTSQAPELRAKDAIAQELIKRLQVPTVFFDARWPSKRNGVDLLVIDRAGAGDVHVVMIAKVIDDAVDLLPRLMKIPAQFRWMAYVGENASDESDRRTAEHSQLDRLPLYPTEGMGRIGVIGVEIERDQADNTPEAKIIVRAERFPGSYYDQVDDFTAKHKADIIFR